MKISVIISTYNRAPYIGITIESFLKLNFDKSEYEIIVVDNNSTDNTKEVITTLIDQNQSVLLKYYLEHRQGVHYAKNTGAKLSSGNILYFTDDDMIADPNLLAELIRVFDFDSRVATVTGKVLPKWEVPPPKWVLKHCSNQYLSLMDLEQEFMVTKEINLLYTCHYAIKRDVFFKAEGFNPEIFGKKIFGDGETGLTIKTKKMGCLFGYNARSVIYHIIPSSRMTQKYLNRRIGISAANTHAYTIYRQDPSIAKLLKRLLSTIIKGPYHLIKLLLLSVIKKDTIHLRFALSFTIYYFNLLRFNGKLLFQPMFRRLVLKADWLSNDKEFDNIEFSKLI